MKAIRVLGIFAVLFFAVMVVNAADKKEKTVVFKAVLHCESCKAKVEKNIPFEKGVTDLKVDLPGQTITITFREDKNDVQKLQKAIEKLKIEVSGVVPAGQTLKENCDAKAADCCKKKE